MRLDDMNSTGQVSSVVGVLETRTAKLGLHMRPFWHVLLVYPFKDRGKSLALGVPSRATHIIDRYLRVRRVRWARSVY